MEFCTTRDTGSLRRDKFFCDRAGDPVRPIAMSARANISKLPDNTSLQGVPPSPLPKAVPVPAEKLSFVKAMDFDIPQDSG